MPTAVASAFDVAYWFHDRAKRDNVALPPIKLQRLLFLSQAYFAASTRGEKLMPGMFITSKVGPIEPNVHRVFAAGVATIETVTPRQPVVRFLAGIWAAFGRHTPEMLDELVLAAAPVREAMARPANTEISTAAMFNHYVSDTAGPRVIRRGRSAPPPVDDDAPAPAKIPRYHRGKPVAKWVPGMKKV